MEEGETSEGFIRSVEGWVLIIRRVNEEALEEHILDQFSEFGEVKVVNLVLDNKSGLAKGYCLIKFEKLEEARRAVEGMNEENAKKGVIILEGNCSQENKFIAEQAIHRSTRHRYRNEPFESKRQ